MFFDNVKEEFPTLNNNPELVYLDSAASTQTHQRVLDKMNEYYEHKRCNVNRGDFKISFNAKPIPFYTLTFSK